LRRSHATCHCRLKGKMESLEGGGSFARGRLGLLFMAREVRSIQGIPWSICWFLIWSDNRLHKFKGW
jgi:hypothetical protein